MWLFTKYGFYSVTQSKYKKGKIQVRARAREDLENLIEFARRYGYEGGLVIIETSQADYRYRFLCTESRWADIAGMLARDIDYPNFKNEITDTYRHGLYERVWSVMIGLQNRFVNNGIRFTDRRQLMFDNMPVEEDLENWETGLEPGELDEWLHDDGALDDDLDPSSPFYDPGKFTSLPRIEYED